MDCEHREWLAEHTPIQTPLHIDAPHPNHTMRALQPYRCARSKRRSARNGAVRSKRRCPFKRCSALETARCAQNGAARSKRRSLRVQTAPRAQNGAARSKWRCAFKRRRALKMALRVQTVLRAQNGAARSKRRGAFKRCCAFKRGSAGGRQGVGRLIRRGRQGTFAELKSFGVVCFADVSEVWPSLPQ